MNAPIGTVTLLFSDIEGSTRLWETFHEEMRVALAQHDEIMRAAISANGGVVFKTIGDAFCAAFEIAPEALIAALTAQTNLNEAFSTGPIQIRVRMAIHTGAVEFRDQDYFGQPLNRVARLLSAGHGGQTLLSLTTHELVRDNLPPGTELIYLGDHRLKDLARPEAIFQATVGELPQEFPPLRSLDNPEMPNNLPQQMTSFVGREQEIKDVTALLGRSRLVTLTGSGGCGKTRLALQVAAELLDQFPDGVWLVELAAISDPALVPNSLAQIWNLRKESDKSTIHVLLEYLKSKKTLLLLDNCEHLLHACASLAESLLRSCPGVQILATSREAMAIQGEMTTRVPSLSLPKTSATETAESLSQYEAVRLFVDRAVFHSPNFEVSNENAPDVAQLCIRLDGIPLAIELAAARVKSLSVSEINRRLDNRFKFLTTGSRTALPRQQTLRALIDWSYDLLSPLEKTLLNRLAVFAGGWTLEGAEEVCTDDQLERWEVFDTLSSLIDQSLVLAETAVQEHPLARAALASARGAKPTVELSNYDSNHPTPDLAGETRYRLLLTVRQYAQDRLEENPDSADTMKKFVEYFVHLSDGGHDKVRGKDGLIWIRRFEREHDNFRAALKTSMAQASASDQMNAATVKIAGNLGYFWYLRGLLEEGSSWLHQALALPILPGQERARIRLIGAATWIAHVQGEATRSQQLATEMIDLATAENDPQQLSMAYNLMGLILTVAGGQMAEAREYLEKALAISRTLPNMGRSRASITNLGFIAAEMGDYPAAKEYIEEGLWLGRQAGDIESEGVSLWALGMVYHAMGDHQKSMDVLIDAERIMRENGFIIRLMDVLLQKSEVFITWGQIEKGLSSLYEVIALSQELKMARHERAASVLVCLTNAMNDRPADTELPLSKLITACVVSSDWWNLGACFRSAAVIAASKGSNLEAACLLGVAEKLLRVATGVMPPHVEAVQTQIMTPIIAAIGAEAFSKARDLGANTQVRQAVTLALEIVSH